MSNMEKNKIIDIIDIFIFKRLKSSCSFDILKRNQNVILTFIFIILISSVGFTKVESGVVAEIQKLGESVQLVFKGADQWDYELERKNEDSHVNIELRVPRLSQESVDRISKWKDKDTEFIKSIFIEPIEGTLQDLIIMELVNSNVESFDYLTDKPSRLIIDFYFKADKKIKKEKKVSKSEVNETKKQSTQNSNNKPEVYRKPDSVDFIVPDEHGELADKFELPKKPNEFRGIFDGGDPKFERFSIEEYKIKEESIVRSQENLYIPFPMLYIETDHYTKIRSQPPVYEVTPKNTDDNKFARLILTLYEKNRLAVCLKTIKWFFEKHPNSEYDEIVRFLLGDLYFKLWDKDGLRTNYELAIQAYKEALKKYPKSVLATRTIFLTGYASYFKKDYFESMRMFQNFVKENPPSFLTDKARLAIARSLFKLLQYDEGYKVYQDIEKEAVTKDAKVEALYLKGDIPFIRKDYESAVRDYRNAVTIAPDSWEQYPNAFSNLSASLFWLKQYKSSLDSYRDFLTRFPGHDYAGYAMVRVGELLEILGAPQDRVNGAFRETFFRYGSTEGAKIARIRILSQNMKGMKTKEAEAAIEEINKMVIDNELPKMDLFASIMISEGLSERGEFEKSIETLLNWYRSNSTNNEANLIKRRIVRYVNEKLAEGADTNNFMEVLKLHNQYGELWLKDSKRIDTVYYLGRAFEQAGAYKEAETLYRESLNRLYSSKATNEVREHSVFEKLPTNEAVLLRLGKVSFERNDISKTYDYLKDIEHPERLTEDEQVERVDLASQVMEKRGEIDSSIRFLKDLADNWKGQSSKVVPVYLRLGSNYYDNKNYSESLRNLKHAEDILIDSQKTPSDLHLEVLKSISKTLTQMKDLKENEAVLSRMLEMYEEKNNLSSYRYSLGDLQFEQGLLQKATETWKLLEKDKNKFWYTMGQEKLKHEQWKDIYKKYAQKIPTISRSIASVPTESQSPQNSQPQSEPQQENPK